MLALCFHSFGDRGLSNLSRDFEMASVMASGCIVCLVVPVLASRYHVLNGIAYVAKLSYSWSFFLNHYLYRCLVHYFQTYHVLRPTFLWWCATLVPLPSNNIGDVHKMIQERKVSELGCFMLAKNRPEIILDDGKLDDASSDYLVALCDGFLPIHRGASFHVEPYRPHRFSR